MTEEGPEERKQQITETLYQSMPGATMPSVIGGYYAWGEVDGTQHWMFCEAIAEVMVDLEERIVQGIMQQ